ncbi:ribose 1,5-bisphosphate isomerase [Thermoplasmatales archaeon BRNA1]|nr:ribose 1,5-bisphosphate isomerase [Thermoplasmatales archaeon BRNA1]
MDVQDIIASTASDIREMKVRGAGRIARAGASALAQFAESYQGSDLERFRADIGKAERTILDSRPTAVSLWNGVNATVKGVDRATDFESARQSVIDNGRLFVEKSEKAVGVIAKIGAKRIKDGDVIMTHCNSSAAIGVIAEAVRQGKDIKVYATESRPWRQGILTVNDLAKAGVDTTMIIDSAVRTVMKRVDRVFVGADTITSSGSLINKIGTSQVALCANEAGAEFNVCSETYKFSPKTLFGDSVTIEERNVSEVVKPGEIPESVKVFNPVFDRTPAKYIDNIITEIGIMSPGSVYGVMAAQLGDRIFDIK